MKISPSTHVESSLSGSPLSSMIKRAVDLGRTYFSYSDLGHMGSALKTYGLAKKAGLKPVLGLEFYFKDAKCPIVTGSKADRCRYFNGAIYALNQTAYQELCRAVSKTDLPKIEVFEEEQSLWGWEEISHLSQFDTLFVLSGPHCMVGKALLADGPEVAEKVLLRLKELFGNRLSLALVCEKWDRKFAQVIKIDYTDGTHDSLLASDTVSTDRARKIKVSDLITRGGHKDILSKIVGSTHFEVGKTISGISEHAGFLPLPLDVTLEINKFFVEMSKKHGIQLLVSDYAFYADKSDKIVQNIVLEGKTKLKSDLHMKSDKEFYTYLANTLFLSEDEIEEIMSNNDSWAKNFDGFELKYEYRLAESAGNPLQKCMEIIKNNGRMKWEDERYTSRLREEIQVISRNGVKDFSAYFLPIADVVNHYKDSGKLVGPSRGSAGGSLFCFLMGITQVDPIRYGLSFPRFLSLDRIKNGDIPDVDTDFGNRELLTGKDGKSGYLYKRWGDKVAQISTRHMVRLKSALKDTNRYLNNGSVQKEIEVLSKSLPDAPQGVPDRDFVFGYDDTDGNHHEGLLETNDALKEYASSRPAEWESVQKSLGISRSFSVHASAFLISDAPISETLPTKFGYITQYEAKQCEAAGQIKYDFLTVSNIEDIEVCIKLINKKNGESPNTGYFTHKRKQAYIWDLPEELEVYKSVWDGDVATLFQIHTPGMAKTTSGIMPKCIEDGAIILALERPGPKDFVDPATGKNMVEEYISRRNGESKPDFKELYDLIPETYGIIIFQEQSLKISKELGGMTPSDAEKLRRLFSKKLKKEVDGMKPIFMSTAIPKIGEEKANKIWDMMETSSRYSFNASHSFGYFLITYACMFLRHNYPLEWWAAILTNASQKEISGKLWQHVKHFLAPPDINLSSDEMEIDYANHKIRSKLGIIKGMGDKSIDPIVAGRPYRDIRDFVNREVAGPGLSRKLIHVGVLDSLFPPKSQLLQKLQQFEDALEIRKFNKAKKEGKLIKQLEPKKGVIPEEYLTIEQDPMKNAAVQKSILPSLLVGLHDLGKNHSKCIIGNVRPSKIMHSPNGEQVLLVSGEMLQRLDEMTEEQVSKDMHVAVTAFIVETEIFDYKKNTKQALKLVMDCDGYTREHVLWPDYYSQQLIYPSDLKKGNICTVFLKKRANKSDPCTITEIVIEA
jgi:DNA-directed DNA polymerase III PolC